MCSALLLHFWRLPSPPIDTEALQYPDEPRNNETVKHLPKTLAQLCSKKVCMGEGSSEPLLETPFPPFWARGSQKQAMERGVGGDPGYPNIYDAK